jgi:hypothetical protein
MEFQQTKKVCCKVEWFIGAFNDYFFKNLCKWNKKSTHQSCCTLFLKLLSEVIKSSFFFISAISLFEICMLTFTVILIQKTDDCKCTFLEKGKSNASNINAIDRIIIFSKKAD